MLITIKNCRTALISLPRPGGSSHWNASGYWEDVFLILEHSAASAGKAFKATTNLKGRIKNKTSLWLGLAAVALLMLIGSGCYLMSPYRDAEVALGLKPLPGSVQSLEVSVDAWTDYMVRGFLEISPVDFDAVVSRRRYDHQIHSPVQLRPSPLLQGRTLAATESYIWGDETSNVFLKADASHSWLWFEYGTD